MISMLFRWIFLFVALSLSAEPVVSLGIDRFFAEGYMSALKGKRVGLIVNHTSVNRQMRSLLSLFQEKYPEIAIAAIFSPEHGLKGNCYANEKVDHGEEASIPVFSLYGETRRPTEAMLQGIDVLIYDIQCIGIRAYTYPTTLFYVMEEAAKRAISVIVLDRPNPINGLTVDGPMLAPEWRSFIGYINVPYCHGMTIGELASFFNAEYQVGCKLQVVPMKGWRRSMSYRDTGLIWIPPSPNVPEPDTPLFCPMTGMLGELHLVNIGIGLSLPFKIVGAPWIQAASFAEALNKQKLPGVHFQPFSFRPLWGLYKGLDCEGVLIQITDAKAVKPLAVQYLILGMLKSLYPKEFLKALGNFGKDLFCKVNGTSAIYDIISQEKYPAWKLIEFQTLERKNFLEKRKIYLLDYLE
jgi:uncharacterized protein YbbC (DUF1343 family)